MKQHEILAQRFYDSLPDEWAGAKPRLPETQEQVLRMSEDQFGSWAAQYRNGEIFCEWQFVYNSDAELAERISEHWDLWYVCAFYAPEDLGMLWSWTHPDKNGLIVMHPDDVTRVRAQVRRHPWTHRKDGGKK